MKFTRILYRSVLIIFFTVGVAGNNYCQNYSFKNLNSENGLPGANIYGILEDQSGVIWMAVEAVGLCKYDGISFVVFEHNKEDSSSISDNFPTCIAEDLSGNIWVGTKNGLNRYDRSSRTFKRFYENNSNGLPNNSINDLHIDSYNNLWIATRGGISKYVAREERFYNLLVGENTYTDRLPAIVSSFYEDELENIWIGSYSSGLFLISNKVNSSHTRGIDSLRISAFWLPVINDPGVEANYAVQDICKYDDQHLLLGKIDGLTLFNTITEEFTKLNLAENSQLNSSTVSSVLQDKQGRIWIGYASMGIIQLDVSANKEYYFDATQFQEGGIKSNAIREIYEDSNELVWIGTKFKGVHIYDPRQELLKKHAYNELLSSVIGNKYVLSIFEDKSNNIWIGTKHNGLFNINPRTGSSVNFSSKNKKYHIASDRIECIAEDSQGTIWVGTRNGLFRKRKKTNWFNSVNENFIKTISIDANDNVWVGTNSSGIFYFNSKSENITRYPYSLKKDFFNNNSLAIIKLTLENDSLLWISTKRDGLYCYGIINDTLLSYFNKTTSAPQLEEIQVNGIFRDILGNLWAGTNTTGLYLFNKELNKFIHYHAENINIPNSIYNITQDYQYQLWLATNKGLMLYSPDDKSIQLFDSKYGMKSVITEINAFYHKSNGILMLGGSEGTNVLNLQKASPLDLDPKLIISRVKVYNDILAEDISGKTPLTIEKDKKFVVIEFSLTDYMNPQDAIFAYKLENYDSEWINSGNSNKATYTALPEGNYRFKVKSLNYEVPEAEFNMLVKGPIWQNTYFKIFALVFLISIGISIHFLRLRVLKLREIKLNNLVNQKTHSLMELTQHLEENKSNLEEALIRAEESDKLKNAFLANLSHEIRTPMNGILGFTDLLEDEDLNLSEKQKYIRIIKESGKRLLRIIYDLVDISKIESNQIRLNPEWCNVVDLINELYDFFKLETIEKGILLKKRVDIKGEQAKIYCDKTKISQVISNLITNAIKYTNGGTIQIGCFKHGSEYVFSVKDTGKGIPENKQKLIFERFRQIEDVELHYSEGSGLGLSISKAYVELHGGKIWVESEDRKGSVFQFTIPIKTPLKNSINDGLSNPEALNDSELLDGKKILIIDDDENNYFQIREYLIKHKIIVFNAKTVKDGIELITDRKIPDLILIEIKPPKLNSLRAARKIKRTNSSIPVIIHSTYVGTSRINKRKYSDIDGYLSKTAKPEELLKLVNELILLKQKV